MTLSYHYFTGRPFMNLNYMYYMYLSVHSRAQCTACCPCCIGARPACKALSPMVPALLSIVWMSLFGIETPSTLELSSAVNMASRGTGVTSSRAGMCVGLKPLQWRSSAPAAPSRHTSVCCQAAWRNECACRCCQIGVPASCVFGLHPRRLSILYVAAVCSCVA